MNIHFVVTCLSLDLGRIEFLVLQVFSTLAEAELYVSRKEGSEPTHINYEIHEVEPE